jgi:hypothetical protein
MAYSKVPRHTGVNVTLVARLPSIHIEIVCCYSWSTVGIYALLTSPTVLRFTAAGAPLAARRIWILQLNLHAWPPITYGMQGSSYLRVFMYPCKCNHASSEKNVNYGSISFDDRMYNPAAKTNHASWIADGVSELLMFYRDLSFSNCVAVLALEFDTPVLGTLSSRNLRRNFRRHFLADPCLTWVPYRYMPCSKVRRTMTYHTAYWEQMANGAVSRCLLPTNRELPRMNHTARRKTVHKSITSFHSKHSYAPRSRRCTSRREPFNRLKKRLPLAMCKGRLSNTPVPTTPRRTLQDTVLVRVCVFKQDILYVQHVYA